MILEFKQKLTNCNILNTTKFRCQVYGNLTYYSMFYQKISLILSVRQHWLAGPAWALFTPWVPCLLLGFCQCPLTTSTKHAKWGPQHLPEGAASHPALPWSLWEFGGSEKAAESYLPVILPFNYVKINTFSPKIDFVKI